MSDALPEGWTEKMSRSRGVPYYVNNHTGDTQWEKPTEPAPEGKQVRASHLLVKHAESRRPSSWKEQTVTRSKEEAAAMIADFRRQLVEADNLPEAFAQLAEKESHCSSHARGGDLGFFGPGQMQKPFEDATFALGIGELSEPVFSGSGVHLILRTA